MNSERANEPSHTPTLIGAGLTIFWLALGFGYCWGKGLTVFQDLKPHEIGDFLGGSLGPLAFMWIVIGYFQQKQEMAIQVRELHHQVEASNRLAELGIDEARRDQAEVEPNLLLSVGNRSGSQVNGLRVTNYGSDALSVHFKEVKGGFTPPTWSRPLMVKGDSEKMFVTPGGPGFVCLGCQDVHRQNHEFWFRFDGTDFFRTTEDVAAEEEETQ